MGSLFVGSVKGQSYFPVPNVKDTIQFKNGVAHTAYLLTSSSSANRKPVRILIYGQSISVQTWWKDVSDFVKDRFPLANVTFINKAIGGFSSERLKLMVENDVLSFYPDLILFHDYGNEADYEWIIQTIRRRTTAEIALQTDHMAMQSQEWHDKHSQQWLPSMCSKYGLALIDVRSVWKTYLKENNLEIKDLLTDGVHLNVHGNYLMASIVKKYFSALRHAPPTNKYVKEMVAGKDFTLKGNKIEMPVTGNRMDLLWKPQANRGQIGVTIDGKKPSALNTCYYYTRPALDSLGFLRKIGQVLGMKLTDKAKEEEWSMTITATDSVRQQMQFSLRGSLTGEDGTGTSEKTFTSNSGKIIIDSSQWFRAKEFARFPWVKPGDVYKWKVTCICKDEVISAASDVTTIVQGIDNGQHRLKLSGKGLKDLQAVRIYEPALK
ncbi:hypothetical protein SAE01_43890 [Segetibacter aerophilus]|uniref:SGNH hydrolase-type esterase domain-containing protein n=2 Tax=Segetibacter aerophilus TaxID=670293 RepID=A0A512BIW5_9BACT|nr:hypothetical protein SAE01_43890 [Segetibacter aerophilus]